MKVENSNNKFVFSFFPAQKKHFKIIWNISDAQLGKGYLTYDTLLKKINHQNIIFKTVEFESKVIGFYIFHLQTQEYSLFRNLNIVNLDKNNSSLIIKTIVISDEYQKKGITNNILLEAEKIARQNNINKIYCFAWQHQSSKTIPMSKILQKNGYSLSQTIDDFWKEESITKDFECPICNTPPCLCSLVIYTKNI